MSLPVDPRQLLTDLFHVAVAAADPMRIVPRWLPDRPRGRTVVIGAGKAAATMASAFERAWDGPLSGVVVTRYGYAAACERIRVLEAAHPVPDEAGLVATRALFDAVAGLGPDDLVVALVSGGGSALLPAPPPGLTLADEQALNHALLASGLAIGEMNLLRKHVSMVKGGRLAQAAAPARLVTLVLSDVPGDDPAQIASGPTVASGGSLADALALVERSGLVLPPAILGHLRSGRDSAPSALPGQEMHVIGSSALSLEAAAESCRRRGVPAAILSDAIEGEAREIARMHAAMAREIAGRGRPFVPPIVLLSGGETSVTARGKIGHGGRNTEFALALGLDWDSIAGVHGLSADTDGIDGANDAAGAFADGGTVARLRAAGWDPRAALAAHDSGTALGAVGDLLVTGPTRTNVNDFRAILVSPSRRAARPRRRRPSPRCRFAWRPAGRCPRCARPRRAPRARPHGCGRRCARRRTNSAASALPRGSPRADWPRPGGDVGRRTVDRLVQPLASLAERGGGQHPDRSGQHRGAIRQDVAEHIARDDHVEPPGVAHQHHHRGIDEHVAELDVGIVLAHPRDDLAPELHRLEHIGLVDRAEAAVAPARRLEADAGDALYLMLA